jgi:hypothetical protein
LNIIDLLDIFKNISPVVCSFGKDNGYVLGYHPQKNPHTSVQGF